MKNIVCIWYGEIVDIPAGWALCDGNNGTPNLRDKFVVGAGGTYDPFDDFGTTVTAAAYMHAYALSYIMKL